MLINPKLPDHFFYKPNDERSKKELEKFWQVPFIMTDEFWSETWTEYQGRVKGPKNQYTSETETEFNKWIQEKKAAWFKEFPSGTSYTVFCLGSVDVSSQPQKCRGKRQHPHVINSLFLISSSNSAVVLKLAEHAFNGMPLLIMPIITLNFFFSVRFRRDNSFYSPTF